MHSSRRWPDNLRFRRPPVCLLLATLALSLHGQHKSTSSTNPFTSAMDRAAGAATYKAQCAACHGLDGKGGSEGPDLTSGRFKRGSTDDALFQVIAKGVPGTTMRAFSLNGREIWQVVSHIRALGVRRSAETVKGNPTRGEQLYRTHGCGACHMTQGEGGLAGPDLSAVITRRTVGDIERAVLNPNEEVPSEYWSLRARTKAGQKLTGRRLNEDTFSIQLLDASGKLVSVMKGDLAEHEIVRTSLMPSFAGKLRESELEDIIAYLASLAGSERQ
jgi:putative heme-binding domain-containing protein